MAGFEVITEGFRCWWPLALNQAQEHVDAIGVETLPTFVIWRMAMAAIHPSCLLQILLDACRLRRADVNLLLIETTQEMARHSGTVITENCVPVENTNVKSFVRSSSFHTPMSPVFVALLALLTLYISDPCRPAGRDRRSAPPDRRAPTQLTALSAPQAGRPTCSGFCCRE